MTDQQSPRPPDDPYNRLFEGSSQETVEILPDVERLNTARREQSVVAGVGRDRVGRMVPVGASAATNRRTLASVQADQLLAATYTTVTYFTLAIVGILLAIAVAILVTANVGR
jgi:hypothetical protein